MLRSNSSGPTNCTNLGFLPRSLDFLFRIFSRLSHVLGFWICLVFSTAMWCGSRAIRNLSEERKKNGREPEKRGGQRLKNAWGSATAPLRHRITGETMAFEIRKRGHRRGGRTGTAL